MDGLGKIETAADGSGDLTELFVFLQKLSCAFEHITQHILCRTTQTPGTAENGGAQHKA